MPTQAATLTGQGVIVGTLQYMAPEQLEGKPPDSRTDLWALGAILYEMLTGKRAFEGTSAVSLMSAIMEREPPPVTALQPLTPPALDRLVRQCLAKAPDDRPDTAHDIACELRRMSETSGDSTRADTRRRRPGVARMALVVAGGLLLFVAGSSVMWLLRPSTSPPSPVRSLLDVRPADELNAGGVGSTFNPTPGGSRTALAWSPDGQTLVFVGRQAGAVGGGARRFLSRARTL